MENSARVHRGFAAVVGVLALAVTASGAPAKLPSTLKTCKQTDPEFGNCIKKSIQEGLGTLVRGIPSLGVLSIDPLMMSSLSIGEQEGRPVTINLEFKDIKISGIGNVVLDSVEMVPGSYEMKVKAHVPSVTIFGPYKVDGKVLVLPIQGQGDCNITLSNVMVDILIKGEPLEKNGVKYMDVKDFILKFVTDRLYLHFQNLFNGDKALGDNMNLFLNENWQEILKELQPAIQEALGLSFKEISNRIFHKVAYDDIFEPK